MLKTYNFARVVPRYRKKQIPEQFINPNINQHWENCWYNFAQAWIKKSRPGSRGHFAFFDRSLTVPSLVSMELDPVDQLPKENAKYVDHPYIDVCLQRAQDLLSQNRYINVLWSGGLDSTLALFSLLSQAKHRDQIGVVCSWASIYESGRIFDRYINPKNIRVRFETNICNTTLDYHWDREDTTQLYVTGEGGDHLFGFGRNFATQVDPTTLHWSEQFDPAFIEIVEPTMKFSPRPIENARDIRWWMFFNFCWTTVMYDHCIGKSASLAQRVVPFYRTQEFQTWAVNTKTYYSQRQGYRTPARMALAELLDYEFYIQNKAKGMSMHQLEVKNWLAMDSDYKTHYVLPTQTS